MSPSDSPQVSSTAKIGLPPLEICLARLVLPGHRLLVVVRIARLLARGDVYVDNEPVTSRDDHWQLQG